MLRSEIEEDKRYYRKDIFQFVAAGKMAKDQSFGQIGLALDKRRAASILCESDCHLIVFEKEDFFNILGNLFIKSDIEKSHIF